MPTRPLTGNEYDTRRAQDISEAERQRRIDFENYLKTYLGEDRNKLNDFLDPYFGRNTDRSNRLFDLADSDLNVADPSGYSDKGRAALNAQAIDSVPGKYDELISQLKTQLSRRGGLGGNVGASGMFGSLLAKILQDKEKTKTGLLRQNIIDEEALKERQLLANRGFALDSRGQRLTGIGNAIGAQEDMARTAISAYDPSKYISGIASTQGQTPFPLRPVEPEKPSLWRSLLGAGVSAVGGAFGVPIPPGIFGGGGSGSRGTPAFDPNFPN
jgi:hypothetical protein